MVWVEVDQNGALYTSVSSCQGEIVAGSGEMKDQQSLPWFKLMAQDRPRI